MNAIEQATPSGLKYLRTGEGAHALVFVHGFLDAAPVWNELVAGLGNSGIERIQLDLAGMGGRVSDEGPFTLERFAAEVGSVVDAIGKPFVIVGQSMGAQVAELVASERPGQAAGLVLLTPVPLGGLGLPDDATASFRSLGGQRDAQRAVRRQLTADLPDAALERLAAPGFDVRPEVVEALVNAWNAGHPDGKGPSRYAGPVLIVNGESDGFVTGQLIASAIAPRHAQATQATVAHAGHWPHSEQPIAVADILNKFLEGVVWPSAAGPDNTAATVRRQGWTQAFAKKSENAFAEAFDDGVVLEASVLTRPVEGLKQVMAVMGVASKVYESLVFTEEAINGLRSYLEWKAVAFGGKELLGVTILTKNDAGKIVRVAIHHRPLAAALRFSEELRERLRGDIDPSHFYQGA